MHLKTIIFVLGIATGIIVGYGTQYASEIVIASLVLAGMQIMLYVVGRKRNGNVALSLFVFLFACGVAIGTLRVQVEEEKVPYVCEGSCTFDARIVSSPETKDAYQTLVVHRLDAQENEYDVQLRVPLYPKFQVGEKIKVSGKISVPDIIYPHGDEKSFDYATYLHTKQVGSESLFPKVEVIDSDAHTMSDVLGRLKEDMVARINKYVASPASTLASGMLFGNSNMSKELTDTFRVAGLSHIIVLSGFNIAIVISFVLFVLAFLPLALRIAVASISVIGFVMMVGAEASVLRATCMAFVALLSTLLGRAYVARQALVLSLFAIIMYEPSALLADASLHLSFLATAGIVYLSVPIKMIVQKYLTQTSIMELLTTTLAAYISTLPYICFTFGRVSGYALLANMFALPFVPIAMLFSFITVSFSYISDALARVFGFADTLAINIILFIARSIEHLPFSSFAFSTSAVGMIFLYVGLLSILLYFSRKENDETVQTTHDGYLTGIIKY
jgi:competence protein ComEC